MTQGEKCIRSNLDEDTNQRKATRYNSQSVLSGLLVCGECGRNYRRITRPSGEVVWRCANRVEHGKHFCKHSPSIPEQLIKDFICKKLRMDAFDEQAVKKHIDFITIQPDGEQIRSGNTAICHTYRLWQVSIAIIVSIAALTYVLAVDLMRHSPGPG